MDEETTLEIIEDLCSGVDRLGLRPQAAMEIRAQAVRILEGGGALSLADSVVCIIGQESYKQRRTAMDKAKARQTCLKYAHEMLEVRGIHPAEDVMVAHEVLPARDAASRVCIRAMMLHPSSRSRNIRHAMGAKSLKPLRECSPADIMEALDLALLLADEGIESDAGDSDWMMRSIKRLRQEIDELEKRVTEYSA